ncbi:Iron-sulfur cluster carrier protein [Candidatus Lokiarchaeum ossiferum]|uniref:Iron-sulfur cluster carrier protein n=1 Tax=Candidatus Lokiarchaeum ossiferum TaxID=2951803 RepID=A0ABY6HT08_9ARCH|nr:Iron-sulfur cluster carrier protein [Candidatus Lokiarchaeum sp. B-35]
MPENYYKLGIVSGKGGVGKTSITASLACSLSDQGINLIAADTDVDAPNLQILFQTNGVPKKSFTLQTTEKATFIASSCSHCKRCISEEFCSFGALSWDEKCLEPIIDVVACEGCRACSLLCPEKSFEINPVDSGNVVHLEGEFGFDVITGQTILGSQTSGKLVTELKKYAGKIADLEEKDLLIIDGPPGIGCPVIAAVANLDYCIVVIEPSSAALHDAKRVIEVISQFKIPIGIIINKSDMFPDGYQLISQYIKDYQLELLGDIPLDDNWPQSIAQGLPIIKFDPKGIPAERLRVISTKLLKKIKLKTKIIGVEKNEKI